MSALHIESLVKRISGIPNLPLGNLLRKSIIKRKPDAKTWEQSERFTKIYNAAKLSSTWMGLTNPPFGKKSSVTFINEKGKKKTETLTIERQDFWAITLHSIDAARSYYSSNTSLSDMYFSEAASHPAPQ